MSPVNVPAIGAYIREQREQARISLRQLAQATGVSNPYLSQIERGLRKPSADILQQLAKGLRISAEALYVQAGFLEDRPEGYGVKEAVLADPALTERQRQMLLEIYDSFKNETTLDAAQAEESQSAEPGDGGLDPAALTWPELAEGHAAALPDQPVSGQPVLEQAALGQVAAEQAVAEHEQAVADQATGSKAASPAKRTTSRSASRAQSPKRTTSRSASRAQSPKRTTSRTDSRAQSPRRTTSRSASRAQTAPKRAASRADAAEPASSTAASGERTAPRPTASRRAAPKVAASRRPGSKAAETTEPRSGASSGNGSRAGRAHPSTARTR